MQQPAPQPYFIEAYPGALPPEECRSLIDRFNADPRRFPSRTQNSLAPKIRSGAMLNLVELPEWADVVALVDATVVRCVQAYAQKYASFLNLTKPGVCEVSPALMERIHPGQSYGYHVDSAQYGTHHRMLHSLIYLADIADGGFTEFPYQQIRIQPRAGLLILFPPFWTHPHRGVSPVAGTKYNISNFVTLLPQAPTAP